MKFPESFQQMLDDPTVEFRRPVWATGARVKVILDDASPHPQGGTRSWLGMYGGEDMGFTSQPSPWLPGQDGLFADDWDVYVEASEHVARLDHGEAALIDIPSVRAVQKSKKKKPRKS
jgi:hypothetical protein